MSTQRHGETAAIIHVLTEKQGKWSGVVRGGGSRRMAPVLQPGARLDLTWRARLQDHLGVFTAELLHSRTSVIMNDRLALCGANAMTALISFSLPDRQPFPRLYYQTEAVLDLLARPEIWPLAYLNWELLLLQEMGFGLDLSECAVTGESGDNLTYISPKTGRSVSAKAAGQWRDRLLPLPPCLIGQHDGTTADLLAGLEVTRFFLDKHIAAGMRNKPLPQAREALLIQLQKV